MSGIILSAVNLNSTHNIENMKCDNNENAIDEIQIDCETEKQTENEQTENSSSRHRSPTTNSSDSNNISIVTLDENDDSTLR